MNMRSIFTFAALATFSAGIVSAVGLSGCGEPQMYCLAPDGAFAAYFTTVSGDNDCLPQHGQIGLDYYLSFNGEGSNTVADPTQARLAFTLVSARGALDDGIGFLDKVALYATCKNKDPNFNTNLDQTFTKQAFYSIGKYASPSPDANDECSVQGMSEAKLNIPEMPAIPACKDDDIDLPEVPAHKAVNISYTATNLVMRVTPAFQGLYAYGDFQYSGQREDGSACSGTYRFEAINPVESCTSDADCKAAQDGAENKSPTILVTDPLVCKGYKPKVGDADEVKGICVLAPK